MLKRALRKVRVPGGRTLAVTAAFDTYWKFAAERQNVFHKRLAGAPFPWTDDPVLSSHRFTNAYRASDRVSQYLIKNVVYRGDQSADEVFFRTVLFKLFNRIATWGLLEEALGEVSWKNYDRRRFNDVLSDAMARSVRLYSSAYIMPNPPFGAARKHTNHLLLVEELMQQGAPEQLRNSRSYRAVYERLLAVPSFGPFLAFQLAVDLNYGPLFDFSEMDFVVAGPGAQSGIRKCFADTAGLSDEDVIKAVTDIASAEFERLELKFLDLWGRPLQLIDCQNLFCEVDKYSRVVHPELEGSGRTRIKRRYAPASGTAPLEQWYPPKWGLRPHQLEPISQTVAPEGRRSKTVGGGLQQLRLHQLF